MTVGVSHLQELLGWLSTKCGVTVGKSLWADVMPDDSTGIGVFVFEARGPMPLLLQSTSYIRRPRFTFDIRSTAPASTQGDYPLAAPARNKAHLVYQACLDLAGKRLFASSSDHVGGNWLFVNPESEVHLVGRDDHNRLHFGFDAQAERQGP